MLRTRRRRVAIAAASLLLAALPGCGGAPPGPPPNFVVVVVDTLRADHLHFAGNLGLETPNFDALAREGAWFQNAFATASWTLPSLASLFVSQLGSQHRTVQWGVNLAPEHLTLAELLRDAGYRTAGFNANVLIDEASGFDQGFDTYQVVYAPVIFGGRLPDEFPNAPGEIVTKRAREWLSEASTVDPPAPFFLYLHYMEPHTPYRCLGTPDHPSKPNCRAGAAYLSQRLLEGEWDFSPSETLMIRRLYGTEVQAMDRELGALLAVLEETQLRANTWLVVTADHGEQLGERGRYLHGDSLDPHEIRVPLILRGPEPSGRRIETPVSLIDVAPTLAELAGLEGPGSFRGRSLVPALEGRTLSATPVVAELFQRYEKPPRDMLAVVSGSQFIVMGMNGDLQSFDLARDPLGRRSRRVARGALSRALGELEPQIDFSREPPRQPPELSAETRERLEALGYAP